MEIVRGRVVEIQHDTDADQDIIINTLATPSTIISLRRRIARADMYHWRGPNDNILFDSRTRPQFVAKIKENATPQVIADIRRHPISPSHTAQWYATNSLCNEIALAPEVAMILKDEEVKTLVRRCGFTDVSLITPLLGVIDRRKKRKIMYYPYVDARPLDCTTGRKGGRYLSDELYKLFATHSIDAHDLKHKPWQILADTTSPEQLYLIDIEGYKKNQNKNA